jgi:hypothetical protein
MTDTVSASAVSTTAISATTTAIALARANKRCTILIEIRCGGQFNTIGELITCLSLFGFSLVEILFFVRDFAEAAVVDGVFLFEIVLVFFVLDASAGDLVDGHLTEHGAEVSCSFKSFLFVKIIELFNRAGVKGRAEVLFVKRLLFELALAGYKVLMEGVCTVFDNVLGWVQDRCLVLDGSGRFNGLLRRHRHFGDHLTGGVNVSELVSFRSGFSLPVKLLIYRRRWLLRLRYMKLGHRLFRSRCDGMDRTAGNVLVDFGSNHRLLFCWIFNNRRALTKFAWRNRIKAV